MLGTLLRSKHHKVQFERVLTLICLLSSSLTTTSKTRLSIYLTTFFPFLNFLHVTGLFSFLSSVTSNRPQNIDWDHKLHSSSRFLQLPSAFQWLLWRQHHLQGKSKQCIWNGEALLYQNQHFALQKHFQAKQGHIWKNTNHTHVSLSGKKMDPSPFICNAYTLSSQSDLHLKAISFLHIII